MPCPRQASSRVVGSGPSEWEAIAEVWWRTNFRNAQLSVAFFGSVTPLLQEEDLPAHLEGSLERPLSLSVFARLVELASPLLAFLFPFSRAVVS